jgi:hypothetical protein
MAAPTVPTTTNALSQLRFRSALAMSPCGSTSAILTQNISSQSTARRKVKAAPRTGTPTLLCTHPWVPPLLGRELLRRLSRCRLAWLHLGPWLGSRLRLMQDHGVEQPELSDPGVSL